MHDMALEIDMARWDLLSAAVALASICICKVWEIRRALAERGTVNLRRLAVGKYFVSLRVSARRLIHRRKTWNVRSKSILKFWTASKTLVG